MTAGPPALRRLHPAACAALLLAALTFLMFADVLFAGPGIVVSHGLGDTARHFVAWREFGFAEMAAGRLPLWNPHLFCGNPYFGGFQSALLYPPNLVHLVLPVGRAINVTVALHVFLFGFFTFLWVTARGVRPAGGLAAAGVAAFGGGFFAHVYAGHLAHLCAMAWAPLVLAAVDGLFARPGPRHVLLGGAALALQALAGHPQFVLLTGLAAGPYALLRLIASPRRAVAAAGLAGILLLGAGLSAAQWMTGLQESADSFRGAAGLPFDLAAEYPLPPENLLLLVAPGALGENVHVPYWGRSFLWEAQPFFGVAGLALAILGAVLGRREHRLFSAPLAALCLVLALGDATPLFRWLYAGVPGFA
ncbi:MAG: hypothetical protein MUC63_10160, partial [Planctomycetes bacterium]|nr:hypothetical protein [Planctomycetota bacterium]